MRKLRLSGMAQRIDVRLQEAVANRLPHEEFLELVLQDELAIRDDRMLKRRVKAASFSSLKTLEHFNWDFNPKVKIHAQRTWLCLGHPKGGLWLAPRGGKLETVPTVSSLL